VALTFDLFPHKAGRAKLELCAKVVAVACFAVVLQRWYYYYYYYQCADL